MITPTYIRCLWPVKFSLPTLHIPLSLQSPKTLFQSPRLKKQLLWFLTKYWEQGRGWFVVVSSPLHILGWSHLYPIKWWREAYTVMIVVLLWVWLFATHLIFFELRVNLCTHTHTHTPCTPSMQEEEDKETETTTWRTGQECCGILSAPTHHLHIPENMEQEGRSRSQKVVGKSAPETTSSYGGSWIPNFKPVHP